MSGFGGGFYRDGRMVELGDVTAMGDALAHRGPDDAGTWTGISAFILHRMLWTTPESLREKYPARKYDLVLTADARIDNRKELQDRLDLPSESTDAEIILQAYRKWETGCAERLIGDFSFAIWDDARGRFYCARDHFGARPFYYYLSDGLFLFGSEIKALLSTGKVPKKLDRSRLADYLGERYDDSAATFYQHVRRLPSGSYMVVDRHGSDMRRYWSPDPTKTVSLNSDDEYAQRFLELLKEAVRARLRTAYTPGAHLSGGLDSSSIVVLARQMLPPERPLHTFTALFPGMPACDESRFSRAVLDGGGVDPHFVDPTGDNLLDDLDEMILRHDEPIFWPTWVMERALFKTARAAGVRMLLSGHSGDLTLSHGDGFFTELVRSGRLATLRRELDAFCRLRNFSPSSILWREGVRPAIRSSLPRPVLRWIGRKRRRYQPLLHPDLDREIDFSERKRVLDIEDVRLKGSLRGFHYFRLKNDWIAQSLEAGDKFSIAFGLRTTYPFFDVRLMEFGLALPSDQKVRNGVSRFILRRAMEGRLPPLVQARNSKVNLAPLVERTFLRANIPLIHHFLESDIYALDGLIDVEYVRQTTMPSLASTGSTGDVPFSILWRVLGPLVLFRWIQQSGIET